MNVWVLLAIWSLSLNGHPALLRDFVRVYSSEEMCNEDAKDNNALTHPRAAIGKDTFAGYVCVEETP